jgi:hypothetical protein
MGNTFSPGFKLPDDPTIQLLVGVIFAESSSQNWGGGENADEKVAIGWTFVNIAYFAQYKPEGKKRCYNADMGVGTILSAIKSKSLAYNSAIWKQIMNGDALKPLAILEKTLQPTQKAHLELCVDAANSIGAHPAGPHALSTLHDRAPIEFNKAKNSPGNPRRLEKIGELGSHSFYAFIAGRECE